MKFRIVKYYCNLYDADRYYVEQGEPTPYSKLMKFLFGKEPTEFDWWLIADVVTGNSKLIEWNDFATVQDAEEYINAVKRTRRSLKQKHEVVKEM